jgi:hypothetical protein
MASPKRARKRFNKAAGRPVRIVVCAYPSSTIEPVLGLVKSAILYGDEVVLHSPAATMLGSVVSLASSGPEALVELISQVGPSLDGNLDAQLRRMDQDHGPGAGKRILAELANPRSLTRLLMGNQLRAAGLDLDEVDAKLASAQQQIGSIAEDQISAAGFDQLGPAFDAGILSIEPVELDDELIGYRRQLEEILTSSNAYPVFDDQLGDFVASMIDAGAMRANRYSLSRGTQAATADRLLGKLPTFPAATIDELVSIRSDLQRPLVNFRAEMIRVTSELQLNAFSGDFEDAAIELWFERVMPALAELEEITRSTGLAKTYGVEAAHRLTLPVAAALIVGLTSGNWTAASFAGIADLGVAAAVGAKDARNRAEAKKRGNPYYFLHATDHRLSST